VIRLVTARLLGVVCLGACVGVAGGLAFGRAVRALLFEMAPTDPIALMTPILALAGAAALAALPPAIRAVRIDPAETIKSEG
jgi:ABC-type antimicrobial peptide transport system permease subunit